MLVKKFYLLFLIVFTMGICYRFSPHDYGVRMYSKYYGVSGFGSVVGFAAQNQPGADGESSDGQLVIIDVAGPEAPPSSINAAAAAAYAYEQQRSNNNQTDDQGSEVKDVPLLVGRIIMSSKTGAKAEVGPGGGVQAPAAGSDSETTTSQVKSETKPAAHPIGMHTEEEMALVDQIVINKELLCANDRSVSILVMVQSGIKNFRSRAAIRQTWGLTAKNMSEPLLFVVGYSPDPEIQRQLAEEDAKYGDILQFGFNDHYHNLTLKTTACVGWTANFCPQAKFMFKVDDDCFVNMKNIINFARNHTHLTKTIIGNLRPNQAPVRNPKHVDTWYIPYEVYDKEIWPDFCMGVGYMISGDSLPKMYQMARYQVRPAVIVEDVFTTGLVAEAAGIRRIDHPGIHYRFCDADPCNYDSIFIVHHCAAEQITKLWHNVQYFPNDVC